MTDNPETSKKLDRIADLLVANLIVIAISAGCLVIGLLTKLERVTRSTERVEQRFQSFADEVQPVVSSGAGKAIESINKIDSDRLSKAATDRTDELLRAASEKAKRYLERDKKDEPK